MTREREFAIDVRRATLPVKVDPAHGNVVAIGDIHGHSHLLRALLSEVADIVERSGETTLVFLGDLIDRGSDSIGSLDLAINALEATGATRQVDLMGNHEQMLMIAISTDADLDEDSRFWGYRTWLANGGTSVMAELGLRERIWEEDSVSLLREALGRRRLAFLDGMRTSFESGKVLFVHAGVHPRIDLPTFLLTPWQVDLSGRFDQEMHWAWIRESFLRRKPKDGHHGRFVVHGHTIEDGRLPLPELVSRWRVNVDGGTYRTAMARMVHLRGDEARVVTAMEAV